MKKLLKQEWKYYLFFGSAVLLFLIMSTRWAHFGTAADINYESEFADLCFYLEGYIAFLNYHILERMVMIISVAVLILKAGIFWVEKDSYGREFFQFLPIRRKDRVCFHFLMDSLLIFLSASAYIVFLYIRMISMLRTQNIEIPWLWKAVCGEGITGICYLLFLLGVIAFLEAIFVDGIIKVLGSVSMMGMLACMMEGLFGNNQTSVLLQKLYGFFFIKAAGGNSYVLYGEDFKLNAYGGMWIHDLSHSEIFYKGEVLDYGAAMLACTGENADRIYHSEVSWLYDFLHCSSYLGYVLGYLGLAGIFFGVSLYLTKKQELSRQGFYFSFGKYLFSAVVCGTFFIILISQTGIFWHKCIISVSSILLFSVLVYIINKNSCLSY